MKAIDLFAGAGGLTTGAKMAGIDVVWAANHWAAAVECHQANHAETIHSCQDLHQANWMDVPAHDILLAAPCCQGHSPARGKAHGNPQHDASRSTAWAVVSATEFHRPPLVVIENVPHFMQWALYPAWSAAMQALGYQLSPHIVDCADLGAPQNRVRLFLICTRSQAPLKLQLTHQEHLPAKTFIDFNAGNWSPIRKPNRAAATIARVERGRALHGERFVMPYYKSGSGLTGRSLDRPIGTITTRDRWAVVDGDRMRMLTRWECRDAMTFPDDYKLPNNHSLAVHLMGNAVPPVPASRILRAVQEAA